MGRPLAISVLSAGQAVIGIVVIAAPFLGVIPDFYPAWATVWYICTGLVHVVSALLLWRLRRLGPALFAVCFIGGLVLAMLLSPVYAHFSPQAVLPWLAIGVVYGSIVYAYRSRFRIRIRQHEA
jgi:hypothetical protein